MVIPQRRQPLDILLAYSHATGSQMINYLAHVQCRTIIFTTSPNAPSWSSCPS
jgi:hypothetical protein